ncbi:MAG: hypothetical protein P1U71_03225 [Sneathiella sp.]|nr:hypothetical protein [Sneathiella sp.]MDF2366254.1 hypothetical protein [Sneathiella sp.]
MSGMRWYFVKSMAIPICSWLMLDAIDFNISGEMKTVNLWNYDVFSKNNRSGRIAIPFRNLLRDLRFYCHSISAGKQAGGVDLLSDCRRHLDFSRRENYQMDADTSGSGRVGIKKAGSRGGIDPALHCLSMGEGDFPKDQQKF